MISLSYSETELPTNNFVFILIRCSTKAGVIYKVAVKEK